MTNQPPANALAYLATPYSKYPSGIEQAFIDASKLAGLLMRAGMRVYSPIAHCHPIAIHASIDPMDHSIWLPFDRAMMQAADVLFVAHMDGWQESYGIAEEIKFFELARKPIFDLHPRELTLIKRGSGVPHQEKHIEQMTLAELREERNYWDHLCGNLRTISKT